MSTKAKNWKQHENNPYIDYSNERNQFRCTECKREFNSKVSAARHSTSIHKLTLEGEQKISSNKTDNKNSDSLSEGIENEDQNSDFQNGNHFSEKKGNTPEELREYLETNQVSRPTIYDAASFEVEFSVKEEAKHVAELVRDPHLVFVFTKMREERMIYPDWTFSDFLREGALLFAVMLGCYVNFGQDLEWLRQNPTFGKIAIKIAEAWQESDAEQES